MLSVFEHLLFWHWLGLAAVLLIFEVMTGSGFLLCLAIAAAIIGTVLLIAPSTNWIIQLLAFAILSLGSWWFYLTRHVVKQKKQHSTLNRRGDQQIGRIFTLDTPITTGIGKVRIDDSVWRVRCPNLPAGAQIKITGIDGVILIAEAVNSTNV
jgi:membrane protein implicated in regulation of membrane protease activity